MLTNQSVIDNRDLVSDWDEGLNLYGIGTFWQLVQSAKEGRYGTDWIGAHIWYS